MPTKRYLTFRETTNLLIIHLPITSILNITISLPYNGYWGSAALSGFDSQGNEHTIAHCHLGYGLGNLRGPFAYDENWRDYQLQVATDSAVTICVGVEFEDYDLKKALLVEVAPALEYRTGSKMVMSLPFERRVTMR